MPPASNVPKNVYDTPTSVNDLCLDEINFDQESSKIPKVPRFIPVV